MVENLKTLRVGRQHTRDHLVETLDARQELWRWHAEPVLDGNKVDTNESTSLAVINGVIFYLTTPALDLAIIA